MTIEEKIGQMNQYSGGDATGPVTARQTNLLKEIQEGKIGSLLNVKGASNTRAIQQVALKSRRKIPLLFGLDVIHGYKTVFPIPLAEAASWDLDAMRLSAHIAAKEAAAAGIHWTFAPMVDIARDPRWGRVMEGAGEDPCLGSMIAKARVKGFQGEAPGDTDAVMACAKHFAAYGAVIAGRDYNAVDMSEKQLWQTYLPPFKAAVDAGTATFMNAFNTLNGIPATGNDYLQRTILKTMWKFPGFVVSDWNSIGEMTQWGYAADMKDAAWKAITAGNDMDMESRAYVKNLPALVKEGKVNPALVDSAVARILTKKFELGLFDDPFKFCNEAREQLVMNDKASIRAALDMARASMVLLKNDQAILPLSGKNKIALIGPLVKNKKDLLGSWTINTDTTNVSSVYEGMLSHAKNMQVVYANGCGIEDSATAGFAEAVDAAKQADIVVMVLGENAAMTGEAASKTNINVPGVQEALFNVVVAAGKPVVVVLMAGRPMIFNDIAQKASSILYAWWPGQAGGDAIADVLLGKFNPAGKLPISFPRNIGQVPVYYAYTNTGRPLKQEGKTGYVSAYKDSWNKPQYAFGHGLSYSQFAYDSLQLNQTTMSDRGKITVRFRLRNVGKYAGTEVAQLYLRDDVASISRPVKELKDFSKVFLEAGASTYVEFSIDKEKLSFYNNKLEWIAEPGNFHLMIGSASDDIRLESDFKLQ
ncbi:beta-glucosidase BglX [Pinibacter soli]|uniref:beta-glucosidase n=1 Tax=Pinibacter soli TaxID=3044211 RepID=A0ABT6R734_9BACT|nr:beta-glucosidase BglX [Pinibacter soli]MDI3318370.1 beta-glucosidase BglX [Pinibacter soli]